MTMNTNPDTSPSEQTMTLTPDELASLIREGVAAERENRLFNRRIKPVFVAAWKSRAAWFVAGMLCCALLIPFARGTVRLPIPWPFPNLISRKPEAQTIADRSPNDRTKRTELSKAYRTVARNIEAGNFRDTEVSTAVQTALTSLRLETSGILLDDAWSRTATELAALTRDCSNVDALAELLNEIANAFEEPER